MADDIDQVVAQACRLLQVPMPAVAVQLAPGRLIQLAACAAPVPVADIARLLASTLSVSSSAYMAAAAALGMVNLPAGDALQSTPFHGEARVDYGAHMAELCKIIQWRAAEFGSGVVPSPPRHPNATASWPPCAAELPYWQRVNNVAARALQDNTAARVALSRGCTALVQLALPAHAFAWLAEGDWHCATWAEHQALATGQVAAVCPAGLHRLWRHLLVREAHLFQQPHAAPARRQILLQQLARTGVPAPLRGWFWSACVGMATPESVRTARHMHSESVDQAIATLADVQRGAAPKPTRAMLSLIASDVKRTAAALKSTCVAKFGQGGGLRFVRSGSVGAHPWRWCSAEHGVSWDATWGEHDMPWGESCAFGVRTIAGHVELSEAQASAARLPSLPPHLAWCVDDHLASLDGAEVRLLPKCSSQWRVCTAVALQCCEVGYVQGMSMLAAHLLRWLPEAEAAALLMAYVQKLLPGGSAYLAASMALPQAELRGLVGTWASHHPGIVQLLQDAGGGDFLVGAVGVALPWLITGCTQSFHPGASARVWDAWLADCAVEGSAAEGSSLRTFDPLCARRALHTWVTCLLGWAAAAHRRGSRRASIGSSAALAMEAVAQAAAFSGQGLHDSGSGASIVQELAVQSMQQLAVQATLQALPVPARSDIVVLCSPRCPDDTDESAPTLHVHCLYAPCMPSSVDVALHSDATARQWRGDGRWLTEWATAAGAGGLQRALVLVNVEPAWFDQVRPARGPHTAENVGCELLQLPGSHVQLACTGWWWSEVCATIQRQGTVARVAASAAARPDLKTRLARKPGAVKQLCAAIAETQLEPDAWLHVNASVEGRVCGIELPGHGPRKLLPALAIWRDGVYWQCGNMTAVQHDRASLQDSVDHLAHSVHGVRGLPWLPAAAAGVTRAPKPKQSVVYMVANSALGSVARTEATARRVLVGAALSADAADSATSLPRSLRLQVQAERAAALASVSCRESELPAALAQQCEQPSSQARMLTNAWGLRGLASCTNTMLSSWSLPDTVQPEHTPSPADSIFAIPGMAGGGMAVSSLQLRSEYFVAPQEVTAVQPRHSPMQPLTPTDSDRSETSSPSRTIPRQWDAQDLAPPAGPRIGTGAPEASHTFLRSPDEQVPLACCLSLAWDLPIAQVHAALGVEAAHDERVQVLALSGTVCAAATANDAHFG